MRTKRASVTTALFGAVLSCAAAPAFACIWSYGTDLQGRKVQVTGLNGVDDLSAIFHEGSPVDWTQRRREYAARAAKTSDHRVRNDYAVTLLHTGQTAEAIRILRQLEKEKPGTYVTAVNLGTALELAGNDAEALRWIREGIRRNSRAHEGTEWLHARILEAKIALANNPKWLSANSVLGVDFGAGPVPRLPRAWPPDNTGRPSTAEGVQRAMFYQLNERLQFVKPPDPVVASLVFDWGNMAMLTGTLETAEWLYTQSLRFRPQNAPLVQSRLAHVKQLLAKYRKRAK